MEDLIEKIRRAARVEKELIKEHQIAKTREEELRKELEDLSDEVSAMHIRIYGGRGVASELERYSLGLMRELVSLEKLEISNE